MIKSIYMKSKAFIERWKNSMMCIVFIILFSTLFVLLLYAGYLFLKVNKTFNHANDASRELYEVMKIHNR